MTEVINSIFNLPGTKGSKYFAHIERWVDADTVILVIELGFGVLIHHQRCRLAWVNAPEKGTEDYDRSISIISSYGDKDCLISWWGRDKYGRWLVEVFVDGISINQILINNGWIYH